MKMTNEQLAFIEKDLNLLIQDNFHPKHQELINITIKKDLFELIKFAKKVNEAFEFNSQEVSSAFEKGYLSGIYQVKREIYG
jgi:hypothetical protein